MKRICEDQFGLDDIQLESLFSYGCGGPSSSIVFRHPGKEYEEEEPTHVLIRRQESFAISMYHRPDLNTGIDELSDELSFAIVRRWIEHGLIRPTADQTERSYV